jgi:tetratricopeptide (TPR) repeat protein
VFVSYATPDRKQALAVCKAIERRGTTCWISTRDVPPGENYQEAIVHSIRSAPAMVLVFSEAANNSDEIKKELSLASRYRIPVIALRIEDVEPSDAFAYELSTRQWIDAFNGWDKSIDALVSRVGQMSGAEPAAVSVPGRTAATSRRPLAMAAGLLVLLALPGGLWWWLRPAPAAAHSMVVRLNGFQLLSPDLPPGMRESVNSEIAAAFNAAGVVGVSTASAAQPGTAPAYALGGTIQRVGDDIRVIPRLIDERTGATLWTDTFDYAAKEAAKVPRHIAVDAGNVVRCGLFGASTYRKPLPDAVLNDYMQFCQGHLDPNLQEGRKALVPAQRVVAAAPDFSWGWAAVAGGYWKVAYNAESDQLADQARASGREAADRAIALDGKNSEALYIKAVLTDRQDWLGRDALFKRALSARRLDCGCEYHQYGWMLVDVGRVAEGIEKLRQADDMLALYVYTPLTLANALVIGGKLQEAKTYFDAAIELAPNEAFANRLKMHEATSTEDVGSLLNSDSPLPPELRAALLKGYRAKASADAAAKADAARALLALPEKQQGDEVTILLAELGANHEAFQLAAKLTKAGYQGPSLFWYKSTRGILNDPGFPALAAQLGLINYWKTTHTRPDACAEKAPPSFCQLI